MDNEEKNGKFKFSSDIVVLNIVMVIIVAIASFGAYLYARDLKSNNPIDEDDYSQQSGGETSSPTEESDPKISETPPETKAPEEDPLSEVDFKNLDGDYDLEFFAKDLIIGDNLATNFEFYDFLDTKQVFASRRLTMENVLTEGLNMTSETSTALEYAVEFQPKRIHIIMGHGGNNFSDIAKGAENIQTLVKQLKAQLPDTVINLYSTTPKGKDSDAQFTDEEVEEFNKLIEEITKDEEIIFIDLFGLVADENGDFHEDFSESDGVHWAGKTYKSILIYLQLLYK